MRPVVSIFGDDQKFFRNWSVDQSFLHLSGTPLIDNSREAQVFPVEMQHLLTLNDGETLASLSYLDILVNITHHKFSQLSL